MEIDIFSFKQHIIEASEFAAMQIIKEMYPDMDNISFSVASKLAGINGRRWLENHIARGNIHPIRRGATKNSKLTFSRIEIQALKKAEELRAQSVLNPSSPLSLKSSKSLKN